MKFTRVLLLLLLAFFFACNKFGNDQDKVFSTRLSIKVEEYPETRVIRDKSKDLPYGITWEDGDVFSFRLEALVPEEELSGGGLLSDEDILFQADGKLVRKDGEWITYLKAGNDYKKCEVVQIDSLKEGSLLFVKFTFDYMGNEIPTQDWWGVSYSLYGKAHPGYQELTFKLGSLLDDVYSHYSQEE